MVNEVGHNVNVMNITNINITMTQIFATSLDMPICTWFEYIEWKKKLEISDGLNNNSNNNNVFNERVSIAHKYA